MTTTNRIQKAFDIQNREDLSWKNECDSLFYASEGYDPDAQKRYFIDQFVSNEWGYEDYDFEEDEIF